MNYIINVIISPSEWWKYISTIWQVRPVWVTFLLIIAGSVGYFGGLCYKKLHSNPSGEDTNDID